MAKQFRNLSFFLSNFQAKILKRIKTFERIFWNLLVTNLHRLHGRQSLICGYTFALVGANEEFLRTSYSKTSYIS